MSDDCESGLFGCGCCCASVTGLQGGIHPDYVESLVFDLVLDETTITPSAMTLTHVTKLLLGAPLHVIGVDVSLVASYRDFATDTDAAQNKQLLATPDASQAYIALAAVSNVTLFTLPGWKGTDADLGGFNPRAATEQPRKMFCSLSVSPSAPQAHATPDIFGYFADGGLWVEYNSPTAHQGVRVVVRHVPRVSFSPAYADPVTVLQHYWKCSHGDEEFLEGFYAGTSLEVPSGTSVVSTDSPNTTLITAWDVSNATMITSWSLL